MIVEIDRGHRLWAASVSDGSIIIYCKVCGCSSTTKGQDLLKNCGGRVLRSFGVSAGLPRIARGLHPFLALRLSKPWPISMHHTAADLTCDHAASRAVVGAHRGWQVEPGLARQHGIINFARFSDGDLLSADQLEGYDDAGAL